MSRCEKELGKEKERVTKDGPRWHSASSRSDILYLAVDNQSAGFYLDPAIPFLLAFPRTTMLIVADAHNLVLRRLTISPPPCYAAPTTEYQNLEPRVLCQSAIYRTNVAVNHFELTVGSIALGSRFPNFTESEAENNLPREYGYSLKYGR